MPSDVICRRWATSQDGKSSISSISADSLVTPSVQRGSPGSSLTGGGVLGDKFGTVTSYKDAMTEARYRLHLARGILN